jgi:LPXTG-motif cell wall-anchored protein
MFRRSVVLFGAGALAAVVLTAGPASAASVPPIPVSGGPQSCDIMAARFGLPAGTWKEIRFTDPVQQSLPVGSHTKSAYGNTVTITLSPQGTVNFVSQEPIEAVYVNKGNGPTGAHAIYRYQPPVRSDTNLGLLPVELSGVDHVVLCWGAPVPTTTTTVAPTTVPPTTTTPTTVPPTVSPTSVTPTTVPESSVPTTAAPPTTNVVRPVVVTRPAATVAPEVVQLPATGSTPATLVLLGALALAGGAVALVWSRYRAQSHHSC